MYRVCVQLALLRPLVQAEHEMQSSYFRSLFSFPACSCIVEIKSTSILSKEFYAAQPARCLSAFSVVDECNHDGSLREATRFRYIQILM